jgi:hypothetical protein
MGGQRHRRLALRELLHRPLAGQPQVLRQFGAKGIHYFSPGSRKDGGLQGSPPKKAAFLQTGFETS